MEASRRAKYESRAQLQTVVEAVPLAMAVVDARGHIVMLNARAQRLFGYASADVVDASVGVLVPKLVRPAGIERDLVGRRNDGHEFPIEVGLTPLATPEGTFVIASIVDITERQRADAAHVALLDSLRNSEERARAHVERLESLWSIATTPIRRGPERVLVMLHLSAAAIRSQRFVGILTRTDGDDIVVTHVGAGAAFPRRLDVGMRFPRARTIFDRSLRTQAWDDLRATAAAAGHFGWRAVISTVFQTGDTNRALSFVSTEPSAIPFGPDDRAYVDVLATFFANQFQLIELEGSLRRAEERSRDHAQRLESLWAILNNPARRADELVGAMLAEAATAVRPGAEYHGFLSRVAGSRMIVEASVPAAGTARADAEHGLEVGAEIPLAETLAGGVLADGGGVRVWDDVQTMSGTKPRVQRTGWHSVIVTTFAAGGTRYVLTFASTAPAIEAPFGPQEYAYLDVLTAFFANHFQQRWQSRRIAYQQTHDALTGLLSRSQFRYQARIAARSSESYAIVKIDLRAFGEINESYGNLTGDALLVEVAARLGERAMAGEIVGRLGGDVFGVYLHGLRTHEAIAERVAQLGESFAEPFSTGDAHARDFIALGASIGIAVAPGDGTTVDAVLSHANAALSVAKLRGHGSQVFYEAGMEGDAQRNTRRRNELMDALANDQFTLYFQAHLDLENDAVCGCEALIRWTHPERGLILPGEFIPFAEHTGIIDAIDRWVMRSALDAARIMHTYGPDFRLYFNLSGRQAGDPRLVRAFVDAARSGVALNNIGVEITETDAMRDVAKTRMVCRALRRLGVRVAIDDFGTGYSSLSSRKQLPVDVVKIDRSFVSGVLCDPHDATIAETIIAISDHFGFETLAEGVEEPAAIAWLRDRGCRFVQGYAVSHPLPMSAFHIVDGRPAVSSARSRRG